MEIFKNLPTPDEALALIRHTKGVCATEDYHQFGAALEDYKASKISAGDLVKLMEQIFGGHQILLSGFKKFFPIVQETETCTVSCNCNSCLGEKKQKCFQYLNKVEDRFKNDRDVYYKVLAILEEYHDKGDHNVVQAYIKIFNLFMEHADLVLEFEDLLSDQDREKVEKIRAQIMEKKVHQVKSILSKGKKALKLQKRLWKFRESISKNCSLAIDEHFRRKDLRCFEELYGKSDMEFVEEFKKDPISVLVDIYPQLQNNLEARSKNRLSEIQSLKQDLSSWQNTKLDELL